jgi:hypothetical protein
MMVEPSATTTPPDNLELLLIFAHKKINLESVNSG